MEKKERRRKEKKGRERRSQRWFFLLSGVNWKTSGKEKKSNFNLFSFFVFFWPRCLGQPGLPLLSSSSFLFCFSSSSSFPTIFFPPFSINLTKKNNLPFSESIYQWISKWGQTWTNIVTFFPYQVTWDFPWFFSHKFYPPCQPNHHRIWCQMAWQLACLLAAGCFAEVLAVCVFFWVMCLAIPRPSAPVWHDPIPPFSHIAHIKLIDSLVIYRFESGTCSLTWSIGWCL